MSERDDLLAAVGQMLVTWNQLEHETRRLLQEICGGDTVANRVLTAEFNGMALASALKTAAATILPDDLKAHVVDCAKRFDDLKDYRNHYVHGVVGPEWEKKGHMSVERHTARSTLKIYDTPISTMELTNLTEQFAVLSIVAIDLSLVVRDHNRGTPYTLPRTPDWQKMDSLPHRIG
ncbi:hypothetical protein [Aminobacter niigataensis]|uniref:hypothetical protein n=1 Tax=Aminobacter niigataensis TaxID=83265 RepID=UPI0024C58C03|nr:hypothetical protein [Aminobacter niigataensis]CAI2935011.1 protein of unknown function [Aminobacter niigataensis]